MRRLLGTLKSKMHPRIQATNGWDLNRQSKGTSRFPALEKSRAGTMLRGEKSRLVRRMLERAMSHRM